MSSVASLRSRGSIRAITNSDPRDHDDRNTHARFINLVSRLRDPHAARLAMIVTGRPEAGWVRETFDLDRMEPADRVNRFTRLCGTDC